MEDTAGKMLVEVMVELEGFAKRQGEISLEISSLQSKDIEARRVIEAQEGVLSGKIQEAVSVSDFKKEKILWDELTKLKGEFQQGMKGRVKQLAELNQNLENLKAEKTKLVTNSASKFYLKAREEYYAKLFEACDLRDLIIKGLTDLSRTSGVELNVKNYERGLWVSDHNPEMLWGGNPGLFARIKSIGLVF